MRKGGGDTFNCYSGLEQILVNLFSIGRLAGGFFAGVSWHW